MNFNYIPLYAALLTLAACSPNTRSTENSKAITDTAAFQNDNHSEEKGLYAKMYLKDSIKSGDSVLMRFTIYNNTTAVQQFCKWHTPFEPLMSKYLDVKNENGEEVLYRGPMAKRIMPPPAESYIKINPKDSLSITVDVLKAYPIDQAAKYTITYTGQNMSGLIVKDSVSFVYK